MAKNRRASRRNRNRKASRKASRRTRRTSGGYNASPQELNDTSMMSPQRMSLEQGNQFADLTKNMHGGMGTYPLSVTDSVLPQPLHASARLVGLDQSFSAIKGLRDDFQGGARRRKASRKGRKASRKSRKASRKSRKGRKQRGGQALGYAEVSSPGMLLTPDQTARAGLNPEWKLAEDPNSFSPKH